MAPQLLKEFDLSIDYEEFLKVFWIDKNFYESFLVDKLSDLSVTIGEWERSVDKVNVQVRNVKSYHPSKISFPGLPSHAEVCMSNNCANCNCLPLIVTATVTVSTTITVMSQHCTDCCFWSAIIFLVRCESAILMI